MKILRNKTYQKLIRRIENLEDFKKLQDDKTRKELSELPDMPTRIYCEGCGKTSFDEKKFKKFKESVNYWNNDLEREIQTFKPKWICVECLKELKIPIRDFY